MNHRITEWLWLKETLKNTKFQPPAMGWLLPTSSVWPGPQPTWPWAPQGMGHHSFYEQLSQGLTTLCVKIFLLTSNLNLSSLSLKLFPLVLSLWDCIKSRFPSNVRQDIRPFLKSCLISLSREPCCLFGRGSYWTVHAYSFECWFLYKIIML